MADQSYRIAFTDAVARTGIPPANPLYFAGHPAPMRYFYFWYVLCATIMKLAHVTARQAFTASTVWAGFGLLVTTQLYTRHFFHWPRKQRTIALGLLALNGADLIPALGQAILQPTLNGNTEWWSVDPIFAWPDSLLWVPHHVASVLCCLLGFLFLWLSFSPSELQPRIGGEGGVPFIAPAMSGVAASQVRYPTPVVPILFAGIAFASAFGLSVYVAFGLALLMAAWIVRLTLRRVDDLKLWLRRLAATAALSALLLIPFLLEITTNLHAAAASQPPGPGTPIQPHPITLSVRQIIDSGLLTDLPLFTNLNRTHPILLDQSLRLALLPPGLAMELGLYGAVLVLLLLARRRPPPANPHDAHATALFFTLCGLVITMFLSSSVITNNDFGYRAVMLPQFFLLLLTAELLGGWRLAPATALIPPTRAKRRLIYTLLALGVAGTAWWAILLRAWLPLEAAHPQTGYAHSPEDDFQIRRAFDTLDRIAPLNAVVAFRPIDPTPDRQGAVMVPNEYYQRMLVMDSSRQLLNAEGKCATHFGGDPARCRPIQIATAQLYALPAPSAAWARLYCQTFGVDDLVLSVWDPDWNTSAGWPVTLPVVVQEPRFKLLHCR